MTSAGPYETEQKAHAASWWEQQGHPELEGRPAMLETNLAQLLDACANAGIAVGTYDARILHWLANYEPSTVAVVAGLPVADLAHRIHPAARGAQVVIIDTPPPGALQLARSAFEVADQVVMPVPPHLADLDRVPATMKLAADYGKPAAAVLTQVRG